jgi:hypothetical protein
MSGLGNSCPPLQCRRASSGTFRLAGVGQAMKRLEQFRETTPPSHLHHIGQSLLGPLSWQGYLRVDEASTSSESAYAAWHRTLAMARCGPRARSTHISTEASPARWLLNAFWVLCIIALCPRLLSPTNRWAISVATFALGGLLGYLKPVCSTVGGPSKDPPETTGPRPSTSAGGMGQAGGTSSSRDPPGRPPHGSGDEGGGRRDRDGNVPSDGGGSKAPRPSSRKQSRKRRRSNSPPPDRQLRARRPPGPAQPPTSGFTIYTVGPGFSHSTAQLLEGMVASLHCDQSVLDRCERIKAAAKRYLKAECSRCGWGYVAMEDIPANTEICYYSRTLIPAEHGTSNYCIDLGVHYHCKLVIDGSPEDAREPQLAACK